MDISLPVLSKLHLDVMISIDTVIFKQGVQHISLVWFLPSKCKVLSRKMESCYITGIFDLRYVYFILKTYAPVITRFSHRERGEGGNTHGEWDDFKKVLSYYLPLRKYMVCVFVSVSKITCTCHQNDYLENTDELPYFLPKGLGTLSNSWGVGFVCSLIPPVPMPSPNPPHKHSGEKYSLYADYQ